MYKKSVVTVMCDECHKEVENPPDRGTLWNGRHPLEGWYKLEGPQNTNLTNFGNPRRDFCSLECFSGWMSNRLRLVRKGPGKKSEYSLEG